MHLIAEERSDTMGGFSPFPRVLIWCGCRTGIWCWIPEHSTEGTNLWYTLEVHNHTRTMTITLDLPGIREFIQEHPGCDWEDALDWFEQVSGQTVPESQWGTIEEVWQEESQNWEPTDDEMLSAFGTKWHDGL